MSAGRAIRVRSPSGYAAEEIASLGSEPSDVTIIEPSPFSETGSRAAVVTTPDSDQLHFIHLNETGNPVDSTTVGGQLDDPQGITGF